MSFVKRVNNLLSGSRLLASADPEATPAEPQASDSEAWERAQAEAAQVLHGEAPWQNPPAAQEEPPPAPQVLEGSSDAFDAEFGLANATPTAPAATPGMAFPRAGSMGPPAPEPHAPEPHAPTQNPAPDAPRAEPPEEAAREEGLALLQPGQAVALPDGSGVQVLAGARAAEGLNIYRVALQAASHEDALSPEESPILEEAHEEEEVSSASATSLRLREAAAQSPAARALSREFELRGEVPIEAEAPMPPRPLAFFESQDRAYLLDREPAPTPRLADAGRRGAEVASWVQALAQASALVARMHAAGWVHGGLRPEIIGLAPQVSLLDFSRAQRAGAEIESAPDASLEEYAAPEYVRGAPAEPGLDIYAIGAMLRHALQNPPQVLAGAPQILARCLGEPPSRYARAEDLHRDLARLHARMQPALSAEIASASSIGLEATRRTNQDACSHITSGWQDESGSTSWAMACVADGMGGMDAGEAAAQAAAASLLESAVSGAAILSAGGDPGAPEQARWISEWAREANGRVHGAMEERRARGGCTLVAALVVNGRLSLAHVGDCRVYLWRGGQHYLLTRDHSLVMALVMQGEVEPGEVRSHPDRSQVTRALGERSPLPAAFVDGLEVVTGAATLDLQADDVLLLCSDGLWEPVDEAAMSQVLGVRGVDLSQAARALVGRALRAGGPDNATVTLVRMRADGEAAQVLGEG